MINLKLIETNFDEFNKKLIAKKVSKEALKELLAVYNNLKAKKLELENLQALQNTKSKEVGIKARNGEDITELKSELEENKQNIQKLQEIVNSIQENLDQKASHIPNIIDDDVPFGEDENENVELKKVLDEIFEKYENLTGLSPKSVEIRKMKVRWGTCYPQTGAIKINLYLAERPRDQIEAVVLHELVHLKYFYHDKKFLEECKKYMPNYEEIERDLKR